jgi:hypothetical protein
MRRPFAVLMALFFAPWLVSIAVNIWVNLGQHYLFAVPAGFLGVIVPYSLNTKLFTGAWPPWKAVWRVFASGGRSIK